MTATLEGKIKIDTSSLDKAVEQIQSLGNALSSISKDKKSIGALTGAIKENTSATEKSASTAKKFIQSEASRIKSVGQLTISYERLTSQIASSALSDSQKAEATERLTRIYNQSSQILGRFGTNTARGAVAQVSFRKEVSNTTESIRKANAEFRGQAIVDFNRKMQDLTSSVQVALGPLSGVASRLSAFAALFRRNTASIAVLIGGFVGFNVALSQTLKVGAEAERQILALDSQIKSAGLSSITSGQQMSEMAHKIAGATLASASGVREAQSTLLSFGNVSVQSFERVLLTAQGLSQTFGGDLAQNTARLGRLLNDPIRNFDALSRQGIQFNEQEREKITNLQRSGQLFKAQEIILNRFADLQERATGEAQGLSGALDTLRGNIAVVAENLFLSSNVSQSASEAISKVAQAIKEFGESEQAVILAENFSRAISAAGSAVGFLIENGQVLAKVLGVVLLGGISRTTSSLGLMIASKLGVTKATTLADVSIKRFIKSVQVSTAATIAKARAAMTLRNVLFSFIPVVGVLTLGLSALGVIQIFNRRQEESIQDVIDKLDETSSASKETLNALRELAQHDPELEQKLNLSEILTKEQEELSEQVKKIEESFESLDRRSRRIAREGDTSGLDSLIESTERFIEASRKEGKVVSQTTIDLLEHRKELSKNIRLRTEHIARLEEIDQQQRNLRESLENYNTEKATSNRIIADGNKALKEQVESIRAVVDSEGQRIDSLNEQIEAAKRVIEAQRGVEGVDQSYIEQLEKSLIPALKEQIETMRANSRVKREEMREAQRLARVQADLTQAIERAAIFEARARGDITDATVEAQLATLEYNKTLVANVATLQSLNKESLEVIATKLGMGDAVIQEIRSNKDLTNAVNQVAEAYTNQARRAIESEEAARRLRSAQDLATNLREQADPFAGVERQFLEQQNIFATELQGEERAQALEDLQQWYKRVTDEINRNQRRMFEDASTFQPLGPLEQLRRDLEDRQALLREYFIKDEEGLQIHMDALEKEFSRMESFARFDQAFQQAGMVVGEAMEFMRAAGRENTKAFQKMAVVQAVIAKGLAISQVWADPNVHPAVKVAQAAFAAAQVGAQIANIKAQSFNTGGLVTGRGTSMSDSIPAWLSNGEFVLRASAVKALGVGNVERLNRGEMPRFNQGGSVAPLRSSGSPVGSSGLSLSIINNGQPIEVDRVEENFDEDGQRNLKLFVDSRVKERMADGSLDQSMSQNYRINRRPIRR